jgi:protein-tyrosine phosphatase
MPKSLLFLTAALLLCATVAVRGGAWSWALWPAANFAWIGGAYLTGAPGAFGKRSDGTIPAIRVLLMFPFLAYQWGVWSLLRLVLREPACHQLLPDVWIGRRLLPHEVPAGIECVLDLTAEFTEPAGVRNNREYRWRPILDATAPSAALLMDWLIDLERCNGCKYIHCAQGHGRTGLVAAAILLKRGIVTDVASAVARIRSARPWARLNREQQRCLSDFAGLLGSTRAPPRDQPMPP